MMSSSHTGVVLFIGSAVLAYIGRGLVVAHVPKAAKYKKSTSHVCFTAATLANVPSAASSMPRNESEYSLGLNKSESVDRMLNEMGELCQSGQVAVMAAKYVAIAACAAALVSNIPYFLRNSAR